jgi:hypothetical protein
VTPFVGLWTVTARDRHIRVRTSILAACVNRFGEEDVQKEVCEMLMYKHAQVRAGSTRVLSLMFVAVGGKVVNRTPQSQTAGNSAKAPRSFAPLGQRPIGHWFWAAR